MQRNNRPGKATGTGRSSRPGEKSSRKSSRPQLKDKKFGKPEEKRGNGGRGYSANDKSETRPKRTYERREGDDTRPKRTFERREGDDTRPKRTFDKKEGGYDKKSSKPYSKDKKYQSSEKPYTKKRTSAPARPASANDDGLIRLNKYLSNSGIASRREADELILAGAVMVNGVVVTELGTKILPTDKVQYGGDTIRKEKLRYVLLNKPKGYITTTDDPFDRNTVMALVSEACKERIYPVGRLDRNTSGLLLFTNDGELAKKLTHPSHKVKKVYNVELDKALTKADMLKIAEGVELEDGIAFVDEIQYAEEGKSKREIGVELHSGRNRIVRRIFEAMGYEVVKLDRVVFAGLTKKDLPRAHWRLLTEKEVNFLQMIK